MTQAIKKCKQCGQEKPLDQFNKHNSTADRLNYRCKACQSSYARHRNQFNKEQRAAYGKIYREKNKEQIAEKNKRYYAENRDKHRALVHRWYKEHADLVCERTAIWKQNNPDKVKEIHKKYRQANPEKQKAKAHLRRSRKINAPGKFTKDQIKQLYDLQKGQCICCKAKLDKYHIDHIVPLAKGGTNDIHNIQLLCPTCNVRKGAKDPIEFMQERGYLL